MTRSRDSHGSELLSRELGGLCVSEVAMPAGLHLDRHAHPSGQLVFVLEGSYTEVWDRQRLRLQSGSILFRPPDKPHANDFGDDEVLALVVSYHPERFADLASKAGPVRPAALVTDLRPRIRLELERGDAASRTALEGLALLLRARMERWPERERRPEWLVEALRFIERHHAEPISLAAVAAAAGRHRTTVAAGFRACLGRSVGETIRQARVRKALTAIRGSDRPLSDIAVECGFFDQAHMGRWIQRATGRTPGEIRRG